MFQVNVTTTTTTSSVTFVQSRALLITVMVMLALTSMGQTTLGQYDVVLLPPLIVGDTMRGSFGLTNLPQHQQPQSLLPSQAYANSDIGSLQVSFSFRVDPPTDSFIVSWCMLWCLLSVFRFPCGCHFHQCRLNN